MSSGGFHSDCPHFLDIAFKNNHYHLGLSHLNKMILSILVNCKMPVVYVMEHKWNSWIPNS